MTSKITHKTIKVDGKESTYEMLVNGAVVGTASRVKVSVDTVKGDVTLKRSVTMFRMEPASPFQAVGPIQEETMRDLKLAIEPAFAKAGAALPAPAVKAVKVTSPEQGGLPVSEEAQAAALATSDGGDVEM